MISLINLFIRDAKFETYGPRIVTTTVRIKFSGQNRPYYGRSRLY